MAVPTDPGAHPRRLLAEAGEHYPQAELGRWCAELLSGDDPRDPRSPSLAWVGGRHAHLLLSGRVDWDTNAYWPRVWGARGLLYVWAPQATPAVVAGLGDGHWRVREMAAKVVRHREVGEAADVLPALAGDPVARVRAAAVRALGAVGEAEAAEPIQAAADDERREVRTAAAGALDELARRLDREL